MQPNSVGVVDISFNPFERLLTVENCFWGICRGIDSFHVFSFLFFLSVVRTDFVHPQSAMLLLHYGARWPAVICALAHVSRTCQPGADWVRFTQLGWEGGLGEAAVGEAAGPNHCPKHMAVFIDQATARFLGDGLHIEHDLHQGLPKRSSDPRAENTHPVSCVSGNSKPSLFLKVA